MAQMKMLLMLSLLILAMVAESRTIAKGVAESTVKGGEDETLVCSSVHGAEDGDTCLTVAKHFKLSAEDFLEINPNINCNHIFIGQWLCVDGFKSP